jgi:hypothetical protein
LKLNPKPTVHEAVQLAGPISPEWSLARKLAHARFLLDVGRTDDAKEVIREVQKALLSRVFIDTAAEVYDQDADEEEVPSAS